MHFQDHQVLTQRLYQNFVQLQKQKCSRIKDLLIRTRQLPLMVIFPISWLKQKMTMHLGVVNLDTTVAYDHNITN